MEVPFSDEFGMDISKIIDVEIKNGPIVKVKNCYHCTASRRACRYANQIKNCDLSCSELTDNKVHVRALVINGIAHHAKEIKEATAEIMDDDGSASLGEENQ